MKIATYNINGIKARLPNLLDWLREQSPDIVCLQELKCQDENFPALEINDLGYQALWYGQKSWNGVAILARGTITEIQRGLAGEDADDQSRYLEADVTIGDAAPLRIAAIYLPNGNPVPGPKFDYKLRWMARLRERARAIWNEEVPAVLAGDFNVIPYQDDVFSVTAMGDDALMQPESRHAYRRILNDGWVDALRTKYPAGKIWTYWDYQAGAWQRDHGFRIDHLLLSPAVADRLTSAGVDKDVRARDKASDHAPTWIILD